MRHIIVTVVTSFITVSLSNSWSDWCGSGTAWHRRMGKYLKASSLKVTLMLIPDLTWPDLKPLHKVAMLSMSEHGFCWFFCCLKKSPAESSNIVFHFIFRIIFRSCWTPSIMGLLFTERTDGQGSGLLIRCCKCMWLFQYGSEFSINLMYRAEWPGRDEDNRCAHISSWRLFRGSASCPADTIELWCQYIQ